MSIKVVQPPVAGTSYPATIFNVKVIDEDFGPQIKLRMIETNGQKHSMFLPIPMTAGNRTGRVWVSLLGSWPDDEVDEQLLQGMTVNLIWAVNRKDATKLVRDMLTPRKPEKGEDVEAVVLKAQADDDLDAPF